MLDSILAYINNHPEETISLEKLSAISGYSPHYLHRKLGEELNEPIGSYIIRQRIQTAAYLLAMTPLKISEIKSLVGYTNDSAFARIFKVHKGHSPKDFRKLQKETFQNSPPQENYLSLCHETVKIAEQEAYIFPHLCHYLSKESYTVWEKVERFLKENKLHKNDFEYYAILHDCPNVNESELLRYDAALVPKNGQKLPLSKLFQTTVLGGKFIRYKFCCPVASYAATATLVNNHLFSLEDTDHSAGVSYFKFNTLPDYQNPDNQFIEWYLPVN